MRSFLEGLSNENIAFPKWPKISAFITKSLFEVKQNCNKRNEWDTDLDLNADTENGHVAHSVTWMWN